MEEKKQINILPDYNYIVWMPAKTGTRHALEVLKRYGLKVFEYENSENSTPLFNEKTTYVHPCNLHKTYQNFKIICLARNPYARILSYYNFVSLPLDDKLMFYNFVYDQCMYVDNSCFRFDDRIPEYFLRLEYLYEDYSKIPFINSSEYFRNGLLEQFCKFKIGKTKREVDLKDFYDQKTADLVYYNFSHYFELLGYDKESWKK